MKKICFSIALLLSGVLYAQSNFYKQYSSNGYDYAEGVAHLAGANEFLITGSSSSFSDAPSQMYVLKVNDTGDYLWSRHFGDVEADGGKRIIALADGSYYVGGYSQNSDSTGYEIAVWYFDANDQLQWLKKYGTNGFDLLADMVLTADNGLILLGETNATLDGFSDELIIRIDSNGDEVWRTQIESEKNNKSYSIRLLNATDLIIVGEKYESTGDRRSSVLYQMSQSDGTIVNEWIFQTGISSAFNDVYFTNPDYLFIAGEYVDVNETPGSGWYKFNRTTGIMETTELNTGNMKARSVAICQYGNDMAVAIEHNGQFSHGLMDIDIHFVADPFYWVEGLVGINHLSNQKFGQMIGLPDDGLIAVGSNIEWGTGGSSIFITRKINGTPFYQPLNFNSWQPLVSVETTQPIKNLSIYPNPTTEGWKITVEEGNYKVEILSVDGRSQRTIEITGSQILELNDLPAGSYLVVVTDLNGLNQSIWKGVKL